MKKKTVIVLLVAWMGSLPAWAEEGKTLQERIKSVSNRMYMKSGRLELTLLPLSSISLNDAFYRKFGGGIGLGYHLNEAFSLQLMGTYSINLETDYTAYHGPQAQATIPYAGKRTYLAGADLCWSPIYGKISMAAEWFMHFDTYVMGGLVVMGGKQDEGFGDNSAFAASWGVGARVFFSRVFALKLELKDLMIFNDKVSFSGIEKKDVQHQLLFNLGLSIFFLEGSSED